MNWRRGALAAAGAGVAAAAAAGAAYAVQRNVSRRWRVGVDEVAAGGRSLPADLVHHFVAVDDGGRIHAVERGHGPAIVLVHGVALGVATWAPQLRSLGAEHRVVAVGQRGHGESRAGSDGYSFERMADDLLAVLTELQVRRAVLVGHSMGGMIALTAALRRPAPLAARVAGLSLVATTAGPVVPGHGPPGLVRALASASGRGLRSSERRGRGLLPQEDLAAWAVRASFGARPSPADLELARSMITAMSPSAMAALLDPLLTFDVRHGLSSVALPTQVVVGARDVLTPPRSARVLASGIAGATLTVLPGCGHMVMLERPDELDGLLHRFSASVPDGVR